MPPLRLEFVGDGVRDAATVPCLVEGILSCTVEVLRTDHWARLHRSAGSRYGRKLDYAVRRCADAADGVVATVDCDAEDRGVRLAELDAGREHARETRPIPIAIGEARPNADAWLLDDAEAVKTALGLSAQHKVPAVGRNCKETIDQLRDEAGQTDTASLTAIARLVEERRSRDPKSTGFAAFADDVRRVLGPLMEPAADD
ncbi:MAG: hypothetical protein AB7K09_04705 [Planctomycetota bacterium]